MIKSTEDFLAQEHIAVAGVSRYPEQHGANAIYRRLKARGYSVYAVNPNAESVEGDRAYPDLRSIPDRVDAVFIGTNAKHAPSIVREAHELGITRVWMHKGPGEGSVSPDAVEFCRSNGMSVIPGACPLMYGRTADIGHRCMRWVLERSGQIPKGM